MHKSEEISDMLFSLCLRSVSNFCLFLCTCVSDVLQPGVTCLWKSWLFMLSTIFSKYYNLGVWGGGFFHVVLCTFFYGSCDLYSVVKSYPGTVALFLGSDVWCMLKCFLTICVPWFMIILALKLMISIRLT